MIDAFKNLPIPPPSDQVPEVGGDQPPMGFFVDETVCIGCKSCEVACKQWNQLPADGFNWTGHSYDNTVELSATTWRHVAFIEQIRNATGRWLMLSDVCKHCEDAPCVEACPTGSLIYNEFNDVYVQTDICNGCGYCIVACPYGVLTRSKQDGHVHKCTLCYDRQKDGMEPACAKACPTDSIQFGPVEELLRIARERLEFLHAKGETDTMLYGDTPTEDYSRLHSIFLLKDQPSIHNLPDEPHRPVNGMESRYASSIGTALVLTGAAALVFAIGGSHER